jgi:hypothetical protein
MSHPEIPETMSTPCSNSPQGGSWASELWGLVDKSDMDQRVMTTAAEMMSGSPLPWPVTPYDEWAPEREAIARAELASFNAQQYKLYGEDEDMRDLICEETEVDLYLALWRANRVEDLELEMRRFFALVDSHRYGDALHLGWWLVEQHDRYGACYTPELLSLLKEAMIKAFEQNPDNDS